VVTTAVHERSDHIWVFLSRIQLIKLVVTKAKSCRKMHSDSNVFNKNDFFFGKICVLNIDEQTF